MSRLKPYEEYMETDLLWLGSIPSHWKTERGKILYKKENREVREQDDIVTCFRDGTVTLRKNRRLTGFTESIKEIGYQGIRKGDLVIHVMDAFAGAIGVSDSEGKGSPVYSVCTSKRDLNNYYYAHIIREMAKKGYIHSLYRGIRERSSDFRFETFGNQKLPLPPKEEQDQIVKYLDSKLSKINRFIKAKEKQRQLLEEQKQAIINQAVTKGLNSNAKMKPSGIEWIGDIPQGWEIKRLSQISKIVLSGLDKKSYEGQDVVKLCNYVDVYKNDYISSYINFMVATATDNEIKNYSLLKGDIIITKDSESWDDIGVPSYVDEELSNVLCGYHLAIIRNVSPRVISEFLYRAFLSYYVSYQYKIKAKGVTRFGISYQHIHDTNIILPPKEQQIEIVNYFREKGLMIDKTIKRYKKEIDFITEYRTSLISSVVTGKVDVRNIRIEDVEGGAVEGLEVDNIDEEEIIMGEGE